MAEKQSDKRSIEIAEISSIMRTPGGRSVMFRMLNITGIDTNTFDLNERVHVYNDGRKSVGIEWRAELMNATPGEYLQMMKENINA